MKKLFIFFMLIIVTGCSSGDESTPVPTIPCIYSPTLTTEPVIDITDTSATFSGTINPESENCETPNSIEQGFVYSTEIQPTLDDTQFNVSGTSVSANIENLEPNTTYYVRSFLVNNFGDFYGNEQDFNTVAGQIVLVINALGPVITSETSFPVGVEILSDGNTAITSKGICWGANSEPTIEDSIVTNMGDLISFECLVEDLFPGNQYFIRGFATNEFGNYYSNQITITTICDFDFDEDSICDNEDPDDDNDGVEDSEDCDPRDASTYPGAIEICDGVDNDCDNEIDEDAGPTWYFDADGDGFGSVEFSLTQCFQPPGYVLYSTDCDDDNPLINPEATEICNGIDDNCNIEIDDSCIPIIHNYTTFNQQALGFGGGYNQSNSQFFDLHQDISNIAEIKMFLQIDCPSTGCDDWDRFANVKVKDESTGNWFEIGRYITPYWVGTQQLERGLEFDVTDFKTLLTGSTELRIYIENWTAKADLITLEFDYVEGTPDYPYYAVSEVLGFHANSIDCVPYGVSHNLDLDKTVQIPNNAESTYLRTLISGWGHATPYDSNGRPCAEWCYRTHVVKINGSNAFQHYMGPIGCAFNPISNQNPGNWAPDRAGWCPGMAVPVRSNDLGTSYSGTSFTFEYDFQNWTSNGQNGNAYYATSTYVVVKSSTEISNPVVN